MAELVETAAVRVEVWGRNLAETVVEGVEGVEGVAEARCTRWLSDVPPDRVMFPCVGSREQREGMPRSPQVDDRGFG